VTAPTTVAEVLPRRHGCEWWQITVPAGPMVCGYCYTTESAWLAAPGAAAHLALGYLSLTGFHALGVGPAGELVVLAEAHTLTGATVYLPHLCEQIPDGMREQYADDIARRAAAAAARAEQ
jgi:hypothetical protein